jgi:hypothetical protein
MIFQTEQQRKNTLEALNVMWPSVPPENVYPALGDWREGNSKKRRPNCRTIACFGGWCAWWPHFKSQGIGPDEDGAPKTRAGGSEMEASQLLFGWEHAFRWSGGAEPDRNFRGTDHELVTHRLKWLLANSKVLP